MKKLLNTLYVTSEDAYLSLKGENIEIILDGGIKKDVPLHLLESIVCFSYKGASPALMGKCVDAGIDLSFFSPQGRYLASVNKTVNGNVHLRKEQLRIADDKKKSARIARSLLSGKLYNSKYVLHRFVRDHALQIDADTLNKAISRINEGLLSLREENDTEKLMGIEGNTASVYFGVFGELILDKSDSFNFHGRNRRPPTDNVNALLSFAYTLLANNCAAALWGVGLDPYVGFLHSDRPGRKSLALDLMEELRAPYADRFVLNLINNRVMNEKHFKVQESGAVLLTEEGRQKFLMKWQERKKEELTHPFINEKVQWGMVPHIQALLLARYIRGDLDNYPPFFWK